MPTNHVSLAHLPPELYIAILAHIATPDLQLTTLALSRALLRSPVPLHQLFQHVNLGAKEQVPQFWKRLRLSSANSEENPEASWVRSFDLKAWNPDADVLVNAILLLPGLRHIHLNIGTTFAPEHFDDLFKHPQRNLRLLSLRFRPYVETPTYYQFLKGAYFDSMIDHMAKWPACPQMRHLSIVQDPLPSGAMAPQTNFAQPIVFFSLDVFRPFTKSAYASSITHLRLRVPSRPIIPQLGHPSSLPSLTFLDISTTSVGDAERMLPPLLARHLKLEHIVLDDCGLRQEGWRELGRACAVAGLAKSRAREKILREWIEAQKSYATFGSQDTVSELPQIPVARRPRRGRRGVATSTLSLRQPSPTRPTRIVVTADTAAVQLPSNKIRILPSPPSLLTFSTSLTPIPSRARREDWKEEFESGWDAGIETIRTVWTRLAASSRLGTIRLMKFDPNVAEGEGLVGLVDANLEEDFEWNGEPPIICFGDGDDEGGEGTSAHEDGCGHALGRHAWSLHERINYDI